MNVRLTVKGKGRSTTVLASKSFSRSSNPRTIDFELSRSTVRKLDGQKLTLTVAATDAAGNATSVAKSFWL